MSGGIKETLNGIDKKLDLLVQSHEIFKVTVNKHETALYGKEGTESIGLIRKVDGIGSKIDWIQHSALFIWSIIFGAIQGLMALIGYLKHRGG